MHDRVSFQQAFYNEAGLATARLCAFDGNENGSYSTPKQFMDAGTTSKTVFDRCVFGRAAANGLGDGMSHDVYMGGDEIEISDSVFCGSSNGNSIKLRVNTATVERCFVGRTHGRFIDCPGGTALATTGNVFQTAPGAQSNNAFGLFDEDDTLNTSGPGLWTSTDDTFIFGGRWMEIFWFNQQSTATFKRPQVYWWGDTPPTIIFCRSYDGSNPLPTPPEFALTEANRIAGPVSVPGDPTARSAPLRLRPGLDWQRG